MGAVPVVVVVAGCSSKLGRVDFPATSVESMSRAAAAASSPRLFHPDPSAGTVPPASSPSLPSPSRRAWCFWVSVCSACWVALGACGSKKEQLRLTKHQAGQLNERRKMEERPIRQPVVLAFDEVADQRQVSVIQPDDPQERLGSDPWRHGLTPLA